MTFTFYLYPVGLDLEVDASIIYLIVRRYMMIKQFVLLLFSTIFLLLSGSVCGDLQENSGQVGKQMSGNRYLIGAGDRLGVSVWKEEGMQVEVVVKPDGRITFPLAGEVQASGRTTDQLRDVIAKKLERYIPDPIVMVSVLQSLSNKVYVIGKVSRPGEFIATNYMNVLQALTLAGGLTPYADSDEIKIIRRERDSTTVYPFDYDEVVSGERLDMNIMLKAGDTIVVP